MIHSAPSFEILDHPAELGFRAWAPTMTDLFAHCALALSSILVDIETVSPSETVAVEVSAQDQESLLYNWLAEILYLYDGEQWLFSKCEAVTHKTQEDGEFLQADLTGQKFDPAKHEIKTCVKAVSLQQIKIEKTSKGYSAEVFLDR